MAITNYQVLTNYDNPAFTAPAGSGTAVTVIYITNKTDGDGTIDIYAVPQAGSVGEPFKIYTELTIKARDTYILDTEKMILGAGDKIFIEIPDSTGQIIATISTIGL